MMKRKIHASPFLFSIFLFPEIRGEEAGNEEGGRSSWLDEVPCRTQLTLARTTDGAG
jgi:hypothetical protein